LKKLDLEARWKAVAMAADASRPSGLDEQLRSVLEQLDEKTQGRIFANLIARHLMRCPDCGNACGHENDVLTSFRAAVVRQALAMAAVLRTGRSLIHSGGIEIRRLNRHAQHLRVRERDFSLELGNLDERQMQHVRTRPESMQDELNLRSPWREELHRLSRKRRCLSRRWTETVAEATATYEEIISLAAVVRRIDDSMRKYRDDTLAFDRFVVKPLAIGTIFAREQERLVNDPRRNSRLRARLGISRPRGRPRGIKESGPRRRSTRKSN
jgi:hypothetical protein